MKKLILIISSCVLFLLYGVSYAQVAINTNGADPHNSAILDISSSQMGILIPRMTTAERTTLSATAADGLLVYDTDLSGVFVYDGSDWGELNTDISPWTRAGGKTYLQNLGDDVGIGTFNPTYELDIYKASGQVAIRALSEDDYSSIVLDKGDVDDNAIVTYRQGGGTYWHVGLIDNNDWSVSQNSSISDGTIYAQGSTGFVGIGINDPQDNLHILGSDTLGTLLIAPDEAASGGSARVILAEDDDNSYSMSMEYDGVANYLYFYGNSGGALLGPHLSIGRSGHVGIGTSTAIEMLTVVETGNNTTALFTGSGIGLANATFIVENDATGGIAANFQTAGTDATMVIEQMGTGAFLKAFGPDGGEDEWRVDEDGTMFFYNAGTGHPNTIRIDPSETGTTDAGQITLYNDDGTASTIEIDGDYNGYGRITVDVLQIKAGSDIVEAFDINSNGEVKPGMLVCIDAENPGKLMVSETAYDKRVAGIVSGANNINAGLMLGQAGSIADGEYPVALSGRVYCYADATNGHIEPGDLLTTSANPGYAMRVADMDKAQGAVIGKAMTPLNEESGLILVLVSLQ